MSKLKNKDDDEFRVVAAIDFGTSHTGYAYAYCNKPDEIFLNPKWGGIVGISTDKAPTAVLTDNENGFVGFGYDAIEQYQQSSSSKPLHLYTNFKMAMYESKNLDKNVEVTSNGGKKTPLKSIVAMVLKFLYQSLKQQLDDANAGDISDAQIKLVLTVPSIGTTKAKDFMTDAAMQAGIIKECMCQKLMIKFEPVAASAWCRRRSPDNFNKTSFEVGDVYMVLDCGGGTFDIAIHKILSDNQVEELHPPTGGPWGGTSVDSAFEKQFTRMVGDKIVQSYKQTDPVGWLQLMNNFGHIKRATGNAYDGPKTLRLQQSFVEHYNQKVWVWYLSQIVNGFKGHFGWKGYSYERGKLHIEQETFDSYFKQVIDEIVSKIKGLLKSPKIPTVKYILMVGEFSECGLLLQEIKDKIEMNMLQVIRLDDAHIAVLKGAVLLGASDE